MVPAPYYVDDMWHSFVNMLLDQCTVSVVHIGIQDNFSKQYYDLQRNNCFGNIGSLLEELQFICSWLV